MSTRYEVRRFAEADIDAAAELLADRHRRQRLEVPALDPAFEHAAACAPLVSERFGQQGAIGAFASSSGQPAGFVLFTPRDAKMWGPNVWAEDAGSAGPGEAIRECYAAIAGDLVAAGTRAHWALVPRTDTDATDGWFSVSFGLQHAYAFRPGIGADFQPSPGAALVIRRAVAADVPVLAKLDLVLPTHLSGSPAFSNLKPPAVDELEAELAGDLDDPKYNFWVAEHEGRVISTLVGTSIHESSSWGPLMKPVSAGFLGYAATLPDARGLGAGRALTETFMAWARDAGYEWLVTDWRTTNLEANRTWLAMGFVPHFYRLFRHVPG